jgi:transposase
MEAVRLIREGQRPSDVAKNLGISVSLVRRWVVQSEVRGAQPPNEVFPGNGNQTRQDEEIRKLKKELERVTQERDFLKKAAAYFAKETPE